MDPVLFYPFGGFLVLLALVFSAIGIRNREGFPGSGQVMAATIALFVLGVAATATWAVVNARDEQQHREAEHAEEQATEHAEEEGAAAEEADAVAADEAAEPDAAVVDLTSPPDGALVFEPDQLDAVAGEVVLAYENPSPVPHSVAIEVDGETVAESETVTDAETQASARLEPGEYVFYCTVAGHREAGMEGELTIK